MPFFLARLLAHRVILGVALVISLTVGMLLAVLAAFDAQALEQSARAQLAGQDTSISVETSLPQSEFTSADSKVRAYVTGALGPVGAQVTVARWSGQLAFGTGSTGSTSTTSGSGTKSGAAGAVSQLLEAATASDLSGHATLVSGTWPVAGATTGANGTSTIDTAVPEDVAHRLDLSVGSTLAVQGFGGQGAYVFRIVGTFQPAQPDNPYWHWDLLGTDGSQSTTGAITYGPFIVPAQVFDDGALQVSQMSWVFVPSLDQLAAADPASLGGPVSGLADRIGNDSDLDGAAVTTALPAGLTALVAATAVAHDLLEITALELGALALAALVVATRPLGPNRAPENALLLQRGLSRAQAWRTDLAEAAVLAVAAAVVALPLGILAAARLARTGPLAAAHLDLSGVRPESVAAVALAAAAFAVLLLLAVDRRRDRERERGAASGGAVRRQAVLAGSARIGLDLALLALTGLALWQQRTLPLVTTDPDGSVSVSALVALTPVLCLASGSLITLRLVPPLARVGERRAARSTRLSGPLAAWQISRRPARQNGWALLLTLAVAGATLALAQHATWQRSVHDQAVLAVGADLQVIPTSGAPSLGYAAAIEHAPGVQSSTAVGLGSGAAAAPVIALDSADAPSVVQLRADQYLDGPDQTWSRLAAPDGTGYGVALPLEHAVQRIALTATLTPSTPFATLAPAPTAGPTASPTAQLSISVQDASGAVFAIPAGSIAADGRPHQVVAVIGPDPADSASGATSGADSEASSLALVGIDLAYQTPITSSGEETLALTGIAQSTGATGAFPAPGPLPAEAWTAVGISNGSPSAVQPAHASGWTYAAPTGQSLTPVEVRGGPPPAVVDGRLQLTPASGGGDIRVLATPAFLSGNQVGVGQTTPVLVDGTQLTATIVGQVADFPGIPPGAPGLVADLPLVNQALLVRGLPPMDVSYWLLAAGPQTAGRLPDNLGVQDLASTIQDQLSAPLAAVPQQGLLAVAVVAAALAVITLSAAAAGSLRDRRAQSAVLSALGVGRWQQAGSTAREYAAVSVPAAGAGLLLGVLLARVLLPTLTLSAAATVPVPSVQVTVAWTWSVLIALLGALVPVAAVYAGSIGRDDPAGQLRLASQGM